MNGGWWRMLGVGALSLCLCVQAQADDGRGGRGGAGCLLYTSALDRAHDEQEEKFARLVTAVGKYWICKRAPAMINEASECMGGAGYVEETILPRLYREAPVNSIWEGSGNVQCLDAVSYTHLQLRAAWRSRVMRSPS